MSDQPVGDLQTKLSKVTVAGWNYYLAEGDLLIPEDRFEAYAAERAGSKSLPIIEIKSDGKTAKLLVMGDNNRPLRWAPGVILSYYIQKETFPGDQYATVRSSMNDATAGWMELCGIQFQHLVALDSDPVARAAQEPLFDVRQVNVQGAFIAAAFFPRDPPDRRMIVIDPSYFSDTGFDSTGVLRHELGHVLGFRHEHIRSGAPPQCPKEDLAHTIEETQYDPLSVMHYFCGSVGNKSLTFTSVDREGARQLYGPPIADFEMIKP